MFKKRLAVIILVLLMTGILAYSYPVVQPVKAQLECDQTCDVENMDQEQAATCLQRNIDCYREKISEKQSQANTLQNTIAVINGQVQLQKWQVAQTQAEIYYLEKEIVELGERIDGLSLSLDSLTGMLLERVQASYKQFRTKPLLALFAMDDFTTFVTQYKYLQQAEKQTATAMAEAENQRLLYDEQKSLKEVKQNALEGKRLQLQTQQQELEAKKRNEEKILAETKNDEATYQRLLAEAQKEINSFRSYVTSVVGSSVCLDSPQPQPDGYFYSQRDSRWCKKTIGNSSDTVGAVGCLISSTAMIWQKHGHNTNPEIIASNPNYFWLNTAYMKHPLPAPPGYTYARYNYYSANLIDDQLKEDRPVIVHLAIGGAGHFVVLKSGQNGDYTMNDPVFGPDLNFASKYTIGMINSIRTFTP